jgi:hypothetical protein
LAVVPFALPEDDVARPPGPAAVADDRAGAVALLRAWDRARATAWREGDPGALAALYTPGARAGRADQRLLAAYAERGLRVEGMRMQVAEVEVVTARARRVELLVTDRLVGATAVRRRTRTELPRDRWSRRRVVLVRAGEAWRVDRVVDQTWPSSTAVTSGSENS